MNKDIDLILQSVALIELHMKSLEIKVSSLTDQVEELKSELADKNTIIGQLHNILVAASKQIPGIEY